MNWYFLSAFANKLGAREDKSEVNEIVWKNTKFNEMYMRDRGKTEKLYKKFTKTKLYKSFLSSNSLSSCFN